MSGEVLVLAVVASMFFVLGSSAAQFSDCSENIITLETALYSSGKNIHQMSLVFFPPGSSPPRFVRITYRFFNESNELDDCSVLYLWSQSAFLIFLPPEIFRWTSLNFFYPDNELDDLEIVLPYECRDLVNSSSSLNAESCTCDDRNLLDSLSQQVNNTFKLTWSIV